MTIESRQQNQTLITQSFVIYNENFSTFPLVKSAEGITVTPPQPFPSYRNNLQGLPLPKSTFCS